MRRFVRIRTKEGECPEWLHYVYPDFEWTREQVELENRKTRSLAAMAFLDHGVPILPEGVPESMEYLTAPYVSDNRDTIFLVYEGGRFLPLHEGVEVIAATWARFYPRKRGAAVACENDPYAKAEGMFEHLFLPLALAGGAEDFDVLTSFRHREEGEIIEAFRDAPAIIFASSHTEADWWELLLRCIIKSKTKAKVIAKIPRDGLAAQRYELCKAMAQKFNIQITGI